jgi:hypothetical protein
VLQLYAGARLHAVMRRLLFILIAVGLSWTTMGYACGMEGEGLRAICCCELSAENSCPNPRTHCSAAQMAFASSDGCCASMVISGTPAEGALEVPATGPPLPNVPEGQWITFPIISDILVRSQLSAHNHNTSSIYLLTGRLRR